MDGKAVKASSEVACRDCIDRRFLTYNYVWDEEEVPGKHFCKWCGKNKPALYWFHFENRILADQRKHYAQQRAQSWQPKEDHRARYREKFRNFD